jgi:hypothetical protein
MPGAGFCRQCRASASGAGATSEQPTAILNEAKDGSTTQRLDPRNTSPGDYGVVHSRGSTSQSSALKPRAPNTRLRVVVAALLVLALLGLGSIVRSVIKSWPQSRAGSPVSRTLLYPGARVILDLSESGGSVLQLTTSDPLEKVQAWYAATLRPTKILQVTSGTVILRKDNVAATLVAQNNTTNIVIKQSSP